MYVRDTLELFMIHFRMIGIPVAIHLIDHDFGLVLVEIAYAASRVVAIRPKQIQTQRLIFT
jgi:hypothetical protein